MNSKKREALYAVLFNACILKFSIVLPSSISKISSTDFWELCLKTCLSMFLGKTDKKGQSQCKTNHRPAGAEGTGAKH